MKWTNLFKLLGKKQTRSMEALNKYNVFTHTPNITEDKMMKELKEGVGFKLDDFNYAHLQLSSGYGVFTEVTDNFVIVEVHKRVKSTKHGFSSKMLYKNTYTHKCFMGKINR